MANELPSGVLTRVRVGGSILNGGGYKSGYSGGVDYSNQDAAQLTVTDAACIAGTATLTSATGGFTAAMVGNCVKIQPGSGGWVSSGSGIFLIIAYVDTNTVTLDRNAASGTNGTGATVKVGGAIGASGSGASFKEALARCQAGSDVVFSDGTYTQTSTLVGGDPNGQGGATGHNKIYAENDGLAIIHFNIGATTQYFNSQALGRCEIVGFKFTTPVTGFGGMGGIGAAIFRKCVWYQCVIGGNQSLIRGDGTGFNNTTWEDCVFDGTSFLAPGNGTAVVQMWKQTMRRCVFKNHVSTICKHLNGAEITFDRCVFYNNTGATTDIIDLVNTGGELIRMHQCVVHTVGRHVINMGTSTSLSTLNLVEIDKCIFYGGGGKVIEHSSGIDLMPYEVTCSAYGNFTGGGYDDTVIPAICFRNFFAITADPFTAPASSDFSLNDAAGGGATVLANGVDCWDWSITAPEGPPGVDGTRAAEVPQAGVTPPTPGSEVDVQIQAAYATAVAWYDDRRYYISIGGKTLCYDFQASEGGAWTDCGLGYVAASEVIPQRGVMPTITLLAANAERPMVGNFPTQVSHMHQQLPWNAQYRQYIQPCKVVFRAPDGAGYSRQRIKQLRMVKVWGEVRKDTPGAKLGTIRVKTDTGATFAAPIIRGLYEDPTLIVRQEFPNHIQGGLIHVELEFEQNVWVSVRDWLPEYVPEN